MFPKTEVTTSNAIGPPPLIEPDEMINHADLPIVKLEEVFPDVEYKNISPSIESMVNHVNGCAETSLESLRHNSTTDFETKLAVEALLNDDDEVDIQSFSGPIIDVCMMSPNAINDRTWATPLDLPVNQVEMSAPSSHPPPLSSAGTKFFTSSLNASKQQSLARLATSGSLTAGVHKTAHPVPGAASKTTSSKLTTTSKVTHNTTATSKARPSTAVRTAAGTSLGIGLIKPPPRRRSSSTSTGSKFLLCKGK